MRSPLEHEPDFIQGLGLITARWAALESEMAELLGAVMTIPPVGEAVYYSVSNFSQRKDMVEKAIVHSLFEPSHRLIAEALFAKISRLWKARNYLVHSHYVYGRFDRDGLPMSVLAMAGPVLGEHPGEMVDRGQVRAQGKEVRRAVGYKGFAYEKRAKDGNTIYVPVNKGTFTTHAEAVSKRARQVRALKFAIRSKTAMLRWGSFSTSHRTQTPRQIRNRQRFLELQVRALELQLPPRPSEA